MRFRVIGKWFCQKLNVPPFFTKEPKPLPLMPDQPPKPSNDDCNDGGHQCDTFATAPAPPEDCSEASS
jgi:hypothetical protein